jgi:hypothetical protein
MRSHPVGLVFAGLVVGAGGVWLGDRVEPAAADEAAKPAARWEYVMLGEDHKKASYLAAAGSVEAKSWAELARALKVEVKGATPDPATVRAQVLNHFGARGWELAGQSAMANDSSYAIHFTLRRRLP